VPGPAEFDHSALRPARLTGRVLNASDRLAFPGAIERVGDYLVIADEMGDPVDWQTPRRYEVGLRIEF